MEMTDDQRAYFEDQSTTVFRILSDSLGDGTLTGQEMIDCNGDWNITDYIVNKIYDIMYEPERLGGNIALVIVGGEEDL